MDVQADSAERSAAEATSGGRTEGTTDGVRPNWKEAAAASGGGWATVAADETGGEQRARWSTARTRRARQAANRMADEEAEEVSADGSGRMGEGGGSVRPPRGKPRG